MDPADTADRPIPHPLAPKSQRACYLPWLKVSVALWYLRTRGYPRHGARFGNTYHGSWPRSPASGKLGVQLSWRVR